MCAVLILNVFFSLFKFQITSEKYGSLFPPINKKIKKVIVTLYLAILRIVRYKLVTASYVVRIVRYKLAILRTYQSFSPL